MDIARLHPMVVHFPIAFWLLGTLMLILAVFGRPTGRIAGWLLGLGTLGGVAGILTGTWAEEVAESRWHVPESLIESHERFGYIATGLFLATLGVWYLAQRFGRRGLTMLAVGLAVVGCGFVAATGETGGDIVYGYAVPGSDRPARPEVGPDHDDHD